MTRPEPLSDREVSIAGAGIELMAYAHGEISDADKRSEVKAQAAMVNRISWLASEISEHDPVVTQDQAALLQVFEARDSVRRLVDSVTVWLRTLNVLYEEQHANKPEVIG